MTVALLEVRQLTVRYGGVRANDAIDLDVDRGAVVGLIGPNGAGKTTFVDAITGFVRPHAGTIRFAGTEVIDLPVARRARGGLARTFQSIELFDDLSVADNLRVACERQRWFSFATDMIAPRRRTSGLHDVEWALGMMGVEGVAAASPRDLSQGVRKLVGVARALVSRPSLLVLDEPAAGLDTAETADLGRRLGSLAELGIAVLLIDHDIDLVMGLCQRVDVLDFGRIIASGSPEQIRADPAVIEAYLGNLPVEQ